MRGVILLRMKTFKACQEGYYVGKFGHGLQHEPVPDNIPVAEMHWLASGREGYRERMSKHRVPLQSGQA